MARSRRLSHQRRTPKQQPAKTAYQPGLVEAIGKYLPGQFFSSWSVHGNTVWTPQRLVWLALLLVWSAEQTLDARFSAMRQVLHTLFPKWSLGTSYTGWSAAQAQWLEHLRPGVIRRLQEQMRHMAGRCWRREGWCAFAADGSRVECPRTAANEAVGCAGKHRTGPQLERCLGQAGKDDAAPTMYLSALVLLPLGWLWSWRLDKGTASEHRHLRQMLPTLPERSLLVADAAYLGYELYQSILQSGASFLMRMSSRACLYTERGTPVERFREGWVDYWPAYRQAKQQPPIRARLLRVRGKHADVWLLTNLDRAALSRRQAGQVYRWRWRNEGLFRTYKHTLAKVKLRHRTAALIFREAEGSLLALQLLLALAVQSLPREGQVTASPRQVLLRSRGEVTRGIATLGPRQLAGYAAALEEIHQGDRPGRTSAKTARAWPRRKPHQASKPPKLKRLSAALKRLKAKTLRAA